MSDIQSIRDDLAYMRGLADDGRRPSRGGGVILAAGGFAYGAASLAAGGMVTGVLPGSAAGFWAPWAAATVLFYAVLFVQLRAIKREEPRSLTAPSTLSGLAWSAMGGAAISVILAGVAAGWVTGSSLVWAVMPSVFLALYGVGWTVAAAASGAAWMRNVALLSFASATAIAFLAASPLMWLAYGAALMGLAGGPGLLLARKPLAAA
jgi:hypothetical protein